ncbi:response regulator [Marinobacterium mangrovicola]|uniref:LuxR family two component transcriptional regulator n=1 Tax=Marinobacterium mangrovicola TaxID=1476959 RepID=A0A4V2PD91_9GAMM|nr:response regulator transcription factor [Marinobacterium mangrovicola]TCK04316.1 LuxR family two component transcriptional regulator [Marinobacterium mangrovicola]
MTDRIQVLLVDDHTIFRSGFAKLLADNDRFNVIAEAASIEETLAQLEDTPQIELVVLDINLGGTNALEHIDALRQCSPSIKILVMSMYPASQFGPAAYKAGADGYLSKDASPPELFSALAKLAAGEAYEHPCLASGEEREQIKGYPHERLSERELGILKCIADGDSLTEIGEKMFLSVKTVSTYRGRILEKLGLTNNAELIKYSLVHGLTLTSY